MKKLTLLLAALTVASAAYAKEVMPVAEVAAAPALRVTSIGQDFAIENTSGAEDIGEAVQFANNVGLAYGDDWAFSLMARKTWSADTSDGIKSAGHRLQIGATKKFDGYTLGANWRQEETYDRFLVTGSYSYGIYSTSLAAGYKFLNKGTGNDSIYVEGKPVTVKYNDIALSYYIEYTKFNGTAGADQTSEFLQQIRVSSPLYKNDKLSLSGEYRYQFSQDKEYETRTAWQEKTRHIAILSAKYALTDALTISSYYQYELNDFEGKDGAVDSESNKYYGEFGLGWSYKF